MATNQIYVSTPPPDPNGNDYWEFAASQDGTPDTLGTWQKSRVFTAQANGDPFVERNKYAFYVRDEEPDNREAEGYDFVALITYGDETDQTWTLQRVSVADRHTDRIIDAASYEMSALETAETAEVFLTVESVTYEEAGVTRTRERVKKVFGTIGSSDPAPVAPEMPDQTLFVGDDYVWSFPAFENADHYSVTGLPVGINVIDLSVRKLGGKVLAPVTLDATVIGYRGNKATPATVRFIVTERIATVSFGTLYAARNAGSAGQLSFYAKSNSNGAVMRMKVDSGEYRNLTADPNGYTRPELFEGIAPLGSLYLSVADGAHTFTFDIVGSGLDPITVSAAVGSGSWSKRIYPAEENLFLNKTVQLSGSATGVGINNGVFTDVLVGTGSQPAAGGQLIDGSHPLPPKVKFVRIWPAGTGDPTKRQSLAGAWLMLAPSGQVAVTTPLETNLNTAGVKKVQLPNPIPADDYLDFPMDDFVAGMIQLQNTGSADLYVREIEVFGIYPANLPPTLVTPFEDITIDEGSSGERVVSTYFTDPENGALEFRGILNENVAMPGWMDVSLGKLKWTNAVFTAGVVGDTLAYYPLNIVAKDPFNAETAGAIAFRVRQRDTVSGIEFAGYSYDRNNGYFTPQLRVTNLTGNWAVNLRELSNAADKFSASGIGCSTGSYTTDKQVAYNRRGTPTLGLVVGKSYEIDYYQPGTTNKLTRTFTLTLPATGNPNEQVYPTSSAVGEITGAFVDEDTRISLYKILPRFRATSPVTYRILKVGGGYDSGSLPVTRPLDKDYYEGTITPELTKGTYTVTATLVSDSSVTRAISVEIVKVAASVTIDILFPRNSTSMNFDIEGRLILRAPGFSGDGDDFAWGSSADRFLLGTTIANALGIAATTVSAGSSTGIYFYRNAASFGRFIGAGGPSKIALELKVKKKSGTIMGTGIWTSVSFFSGGINSQPLNNGVDFACAGEVVSATKTYPANVSNVNIYPITDSEATYGFYVLDLVNFTADFFPGTTNPLTSAGTVATIGPTFAGTLVKNGTERNPGFMNTSLLSYANGRFRLNDSASPSGSGLVVKYLINNVKFYDPPLSAREFQAGIPLLIQKFLVNPNTPQYLWTRNPPEGAGDRNRNDEITLILI